MYSTHSHDLFSILHNKEQHISVFKFKNFLTCCATYPVMVSGRFKRRSKMPDYPVGRIFGESSHTVLRLTRQRTLLCPMNKMETF